MRRRRAARAASIGSGSRSSVTSPIVGVTTGSTSGTVRSPSGTSKTWSHVCAITDDSPASRTCAKSVVVEFVSTTGSGAVPDLTEGGVDDPPVLHVVGQEAQRHRRRVRPADAPRAAERPVGRGQQHVALPVERQRANARQRLGVEVRDPDVELEVVEAALDLDRAERLHADANAGCRAQSGPVNSETLDSEVGTAPSRRRPDGPCAERSDGVVQPVDVGEDQLRPFENLLALRR